MKLELEDIECEAFMTLERRIKEFISRLRLEDRIISINVFPEMVCGNQYQWWRGLIWYVTS